MKVLTDVLGVFNFQAKYINCLWFKMRCGPSSFSKPLVSIAFYLAVRPLAQGNLGRPRVRHGKLIRSDCGTPFVLSHRSIERNMCTVC